MLRKMAIAGFVALMSAPVSAGAASYGVGMEAVVPVVCRAEARAEAGKLVEFCNNAAGYEVWLRHAAGADGEVEVDGVAMRLSPDGRTLISRSATAASRTRAFAVRADLGQVFVEARPL